MSWPIYCEECGKELTDKELLNGVGFESFCDECIDND